MTLNLSKAKAGQIAHLRCGGKAKIDKIEVFGMEIGAKIIHFNGFDRRTFHSNGVGWADGDNDIANIIRLEDPPFKWEDVKPGMAFKYKYNGGNEIAWYVFSLKDGGRCFSIREHACPQSLYGIREEDRLPEEDIEDVHL